MGALPHHLHTVWARFSNHQSVAPKARQKVFGQGSGSGQDT
ncbi:hypothetical protein IEO21_10000 [Rhodonia placenta]|uniref:Uncharacterized protein n=1 Tax=Rhodonia placenta TaxID=104341 RepID=A0A8H7NTE5_9APHY|nr:hypothetical protein IEO21_10000 [Postia placenta]